MKDKIKIFKDCVLEFVKEKRSYCLIGAVTIVVIFAIISIFIIMSKDVINYSGNLINNGFAVNLGRWTYYIKQDGIYKVNSKGNKIEQILNGSMSYLNSDGKYLYFIENIDEEYNLVKIKKNGKDKQNIIGNIDNEMITVSNGWIYYLQDEILYKIRKNGKDKIKLSSQDIVSYQIEGNNIYYTYKNGIDCVIAKMKTNGTKMTDLDNNCNPNFYVDGNKIHYVKEKYSIKKYQYEYTLCKMNTNGDKKQEIIKLPDTMKQINMAEDGAYYLSTENYEKYELYKIKYNGKDEIKITETTLNTKINVIGKKIYYMDLINDNETAIYRINVKGTEKQVL